MATDEDFQEFEIDPRVYAMAEARAKELGFESVDDYFAALATAELERADTPEHRAAHDRMRQILSQGGKDHSAN